MKIPGLPPQFNFEEDEAPPEIDVAQARQAWRTENADALKDFEDKIAALRMAIRKTQGDHSALAAQAKAAIDVMVGKAKEKAKKAKKDK